MKKLSTMWTTNVEIEACLDRRIFRIKELRILFRGKIKFPKSFHKSRIVTIFVSTNFHEFAKISTAKN